MVTICGDVVTICGAVVTISGDVVRPLAAQLANCGDVAAISTVH